MDLIYVSVTVLTVKLFWAFLNSMLRTQAMAVQVASIDNIQKATAVAIRVIIVTLLLIFVILPQIASGPTNDLFAPATSEFRVLDYDLVYGEVTVNNFLNGRDLTWSDRVLNEVDARSNAIVVDIYLHDETQSDVLEYLKSSTTPAILDVGEGTFSKTINERQLPDFSYYELSVYSSSRDSLKIGINEQH